MQTQEKVFQAEYSNVWNFALHKRKGNKKWWKTVVKHEFNLLIFLSKSKLEIANLRTNFSQWILSACIKRITLTPNPQLLCSVKEIFKNSVFQCRVSGYCVGRSNVEVFLSVATPKTFPVHRSSFLHSCVNICLSFVSLFLVFQVCVFAMAPFLRIAFNDFNLGSLPPLTDAPFCAIKMKESLSTG